MLGEAKKIGVHLLQFIVPQKLEGTELNSEQRKLNFVTHTQNPIALSAKWQILVNKLLC